MRRNRFRWTRKSYRQAHQIARLLSRFLDLPDRAPAIVRRYWELWERYPSYGDPLAEPAAWRRHYRDDIPF